MTVKEYPSAHGAKFYELELTCGRGTLAPPGGSQRKAPTVEPRWTIVGKKGPIYFVDISASWLTRVLMADPVGNDPRMREVNNTIAPELLREILASVKTFPTRRPRGICIGDLTNQGAGNAVGVP